MSERYRVKREAWEIDLSGGSVKLLYRKMERTTPLHKQLLEETSQLCLGIFKVAGVAVAAQFLNLVGEPPIHDSTLGKLVDAF